MIWICVIGGRKEGRTGFCSNGVSHYCNKKIKLQIKICFMANKKAEPEPVLLVKISL